MGFALREHTADVAVEAWEETLAGVFAAVANGLASTMCDCPPDVGERFDLSVSSESAEALLFDYLDELIYQRDVRNILPVDNVATIDREEERWRLDASARGIPLSKVDAREVKAVTYSDMRLEESTEGWEAYVVFDV